jgi:hypothetical protein
MAFCGNCGMQLSDASKFCGSCGAPAEKNATPRVAQTSALPPAPPAAGATTSPTVKILLGVVIFLLVVVLAGGGAVAYFVHRANQQAQQISQAASDPAALLDSVQKSLRTAPMPTPAPSGASSPTPGAPSTPTSAVVLEEKHITKADGQCAIFTTDELAKVLGDPFTHADADAAGCTYKGDARGQYVRTEILWTGGHKLLKEKKDNVAFMRQSMANQHYSKAEIDSHQFPVGHPYAGVGDEGWISNMWNVVNGRKGDVGVTLDLRAYPVSDDTNRMLVNTALSRVTGDSSIPYQTPKQP